MTICLSLVLSSGATHCPAAGKTATTAKAASAGTASRPADDGTAVFEVKTVKRPVVYTAVGSVRPRVQAKVMAQAGGRIVEMKVKEGDHVLKGGEMARIEDRQLDLRRSQAQSAVEAAQAQKMRAEYAKVGALALLSQARSEYERIKKLHAHKAATDQQLERAKASFEQARSSVAGAEEAIKAAASAVNRANKAVEEVEVAIGYTRVTAPFDGVVTRRFVDPGDLAWQGRPLFELSAPGDMRLEVRVREGLAGKIDRGQPLSVLIDALEKRITGKVEEIVPSSDPQSRTFMVKIALQRAPRLLPGMFGRAEIPVGSRNALLVPVEAIGERGQLSLVRVRVKGGFEKRVVRVGKPFRKFIEVISGLAPGETIAADYGEVSK